MFDPAAIDAFLRLGVAGLLAVAVIAYTLGVVRSGKLVDRETTRLIKERDDALALAQSYSDNFERALDIIESKNSKSPSST